MFKRVRLDLDTGCGTPISPPLGDEIQESTLRVESFSSEVFRRKKRDSYELIRDLGHGGFGLVRHVKNEATQKSYAVKTSLSFEHTNLITDEAAMLELIGSKGGERHHIVKKEFLGTFEDKPALFLELIDGKDLCDHVEESGLTGILLRDIQNVARQVLDALAFLAAEKIVHGDLKPENILIDSNKKITIVDFAFAFQGTRSGVFPCSLNYASPEVVVGFSLDSALDVWSLGATLISAYTNLMFFSVENRFEVISIHEKRLNKVYPIKLQNECYRGARKKPFLNNESNSISTEILKIGDLRGEDPLEVNKFCRFVELLLEFDPEVRITAKKALDDVFCSS